MRHAEHARHRLHAVVGDRRRARQGPDARRGRARRPRAMSPPRSPPRTGSTIGSGPRAGASFSSHGEDGRIERRIRERAHDASRDEGSSQSGAAGVLGAVAAPSVARAQTRRWRMVTSWPKRSARPRHVGRARRRTHQRVVRRAAADRRSTPRARSCRRFEVLDAVGVRRRRDGPHRVVLLAGQGPGRGVLHHRSVRAHAWRACRLGRCRRRPGAVGRALRAVRREAVHGRQYRRLHGRLVPPRDQRASPICAA